MRVYDFRIELRVLAAGHLTFSKLRRHGEDVRELRYLSERAREGFHARGWAVEIGGP